METAIIVALITAVSGIIIAWIQFGGKGPKPTPTRPLPTGDIEEILRKHPDVARALDHDALRRTAEAAVQFYCNRIEPPKDVNQKSVTWRRVETIHAEMVAGAW